MLTLPFFILIYWRQLNALSVTSGLTAVLRLSLDLILDLSFFIFGAIIAFTKAREILRSRLLLLGD